MVGRNKKTHGATRKQVEVVSEREEILCLDVPTREGRKSKTVRNFKRKEPEKKPQKKGDVFAGFDVEGAGEDEKNQIREAILASTNEEQEHQDCVTTNGDESDLNSSQTTETSDSDVIKVSTDTSKVEDSTTEVNTSVEKLGDDDDDETQAPSESDVEEIDFSLNLDQSTLEESEDNIFDTDSTAKEDADSTIKDDIFKIEIEDVKSCKEIDMESSKSTDRDTSKQEEEDEETSDTLNKTKESEQVNETCESGGFEMQCDVEEDVKTTDSECNRIENLESGQRSRRSVSPEMPCRPDLPDCREKNSLQKSLSQGSLGSAKEAVRSSGSRSKSGTPDRQSSKSNTQESEIPCNYAPLKRHYRGVRTENVRHEKYFGTCETDELEKSALAIYQLFEIYRRKLHVAQRKLHEKATWSEPVKSGQHQSRTIDVKKRGKESIYVDLSDDDEDVKNQKLESGREGQQRRNYKGEIDSDDELPELIIEGENDNESVTRGRLARKPLRSNFVDKEIMSADTQPYDIDNDDDDFVIQVKPRTGRGRPRAGTSKESVKESLKVSDNTLTKEVEDRLTRHRPDRRIGLNGGKADSELLVEDTQQEDLDLQEAIRRSKSDSQKSIEETQFQDEDFDYLNVNKIGEKEQFENPMHKAKLLGYSIPKVGQKHNKGHQKIIYAEKNNESEDVENNFEGIENIRETKAKCHIEEEPEDTRDSKPQRGRKRKAKKQQGDILVEETQDLDAEDDGRNRVRGKRKRNCFKINSESEEESIPESQDIDGLSDHNVDDNKESESGKCNTDKKSKSFISSMFNKVKNFVSPMKSEKTEENNDEGSQSPVISKRKLHNNASKKVYPKPNDKDNAEYEADAFKEYKANSAEKKFKTANTSLTNTRKGRVQMPFAESDFIEEDGIPEGVKRFISRPCSKDSNASDNLSTTSSQMSTNILDEKGDLYSTQYCEIKSRKGKDLKTKSRQSQNIKEEMDEVLLLDESDDDIVVLDEPKKTYSVKRSNKKLPVVKGARILGKRDKQDAKTENIKQYFGKIKKPGEEDDIDLDWNEAELRQKDRRYMKGSDNNIDNVLEDTKHKGATSRSKSDLDKESKQNSVKIPFISVPDTATEHEVGKVKVGSNHGLFNIDSGTSPELRKRLGISKGKGKHAETKTLLTLDIESDDPPVMLNDLNTVTRNRMNGMDQINSGARPKTRNIDAASMLEPRPIRRRKVSETITRADLEEGPIESTGDQGIGMKMGDMRNSSRKRMGGHLIDEDDDQVTFKSKIEKVECPICSRSFPANVIQQHASTCEGQDDNGEENTSNEMDQDEYRIIAEHHPHMSQQELAHHLSQQHRMAEQHESQQHHLHLHDHDHHHLHHMEGLHDHHAHHDHPEALHRHDGHLHNADEAVSHLIQNDQHLQDVAKHISCSPGEEGEVEACYICDAQIPKGKPYQTHVSRCLTIAAQQQAVVDKKGYRKAFEEPEIEEEAQVRNLRGRQVNNDGSATPSRGSVRGRQHGDDSPVGRRRPKRELGEGSPASVLSDHDHDRTSTRGQASGDEDPENPIGAARRVMKRGNYRNRAAVNDEGYKSDPVITLDTEEDSANTSGSSWEDSSSTDDDDNITLASVVRSGSSALITGPWNKNKEQSNKHSANQSENCNNVPDWVRDGINSPIKSFVPISQQEDSEYFQKQFSYKKDRVENRMNKRKRARTGGQKRRRKRRKVRKPKVKK